nr:immunoglobulin light chain junction region [Macaca mulatta]
DYYCVIWHSNAWVF